MIKKITLLVRSTPDYGFLSEIPSTLDDVTASLLEPTNCAYHIAMRANLKPGDSVAVFGLGAMGIIAAIILKQLGAGAVVCVGRRPARQEKARRTGIFDAVVCMMEKIQDDLKKIINVYDYQDALQAFEDAKSGEAIKAVITF